MLSARELTRELPDQARDLDERAAGLYPRLWHHRRAGQRGHAAGHAGLPGERHQPRAEAAGRRAAHLLRRGRTDAYVVTQTTTQEFDYPLARAHDIGATTTWKGTTGVGIGNFVTRALFALRFGDLNLLISNQLTDQSQILFRRTLEERVPEIAPFLSYDRDPYLVSANQRLYWVWDAYTTTDRYPDAQPLPDGPLRRRQLRPQQREGGRRCLRRHGPLLPRRPERADHRGVRPHLPHPVRAARRHAERAASPSALSGGPLHRAEPGVPALPPAGDRWRRHHVLQPGQPVGVPGGRRQGDRRADGAVLRDHADSRRPAGRVRPHPAARAGGPVEHDRVGRGADGSGRLRAARSPSSSRPTPPPWGRRRSRRGSTRTPP